MTGPLNTVAAFVKRSVATAISLIASCTAGSESRILTGLENFDAGSLVCGCEFRESVAGAEEGSYGSGPLVFVIAPNAEPPHALVNRGAGNIRLHSMTPVEFPHFHCEIGKRFISEWGFRSLIVRATLDVTGPGEEACWFEGMIAVNAGRDHGRIPVKGACRC